MPLIKYYDDVKYLVGKNAADNWKLIENADDTDLWIHLQNTSSSHVIIENTKELTNDHIIFGCELCREHSKERNTKKLRVSVLEKKYVKKGKCVGEAILLTQPRVYILN